MLTLCLLLQVLDRYIHDSTEDAHHSSAEASESASDTDSSANADDASSSEGDQSAESQSPTHIARLSISDHAQSAGLAIDAALHQSDVPTDRQSPDNEGPADAQQQLRQQADEQQHVHEHVPEQVLVRGRTAAPQSQPADDADQHIDVDDCRSVSQAHRPGQAAVQQRVLDQHRSRLRKQMLARATRNAQKSGSKKDRKQAAGQADW